jgi:hypothetical protein
MFLGRIFHDSSERICASFNLFESLHVAIAVSEPKSRETQKAINETSIGACLGVSDSATNKCHTVAWLATVFLETSTRRFDTLGSAKAGYTDKMWAIPQADSEH